MVLIFCSVVCMVERGTGYSTNIEMLYLFLVSHEVSKSMSSGDINIGYSEQGKSKKTNHPLAFFCTLLQ